MKNNCLIGNYCAGQWHYECAPTGQDWMGDDIFTQGSICDPSELCNGCEKPIGDGHKPEGENNAS